MSFCGDDAPAAPTYDANANAEALRFQREVYDRTEARRAREDAESAPYVKEARDLGLRLARGQEQDANLAREDAALSRATWRQRGIPLLNRVTDEAEAYGGSADQAAQAGRAVADVRSQGANTLAQSRRALASMGVNPNSGRFAAMGRGHDLQLAAMGAGAATNARTASRDKGMALRAGALAGLQGQQNMAGQNMGLGINAGNASMASMGGSANAGLPGAQFATGGLQGAMGIGNSMMANNAATWNAQNSIYNSQMSQYNADQAATGQMLGMVGGLAARAALS